MVPRFIMVGVAIYFVFALMTNGIEGKEITRDSQDIAVTVNQLTDVSHQKRDAGSGFQFPEEMRFAIGLGDEQIVMNLKKHSLMNSDIALFDDNGVINNEFGKNVAVYQDIASMASMVVECDDQTFECTLLGSLFVTGQRWRISPDETILSSHRMRREEITEANFAGVSLEQEKRQIARQVVRETGEYLYDLYDHYNPTAYPEYSSIPECFIVEAIAMVDESVYDFFLDWAGGNITLALHKLVKYYLGLYSEIDLRFSMFDQVDGSCGCIRIHLRGINSYDSRPDSWSVPAELDDNSGRIDGAIALKKCGKKANNLRSIPGMRQFDLVQCFTRKPMVYDENYDGNYNEHTMSIGYIGTACDMYLQKFQVSLTVDRGDHSDLSAARGIGYNLGARADGKAGCDDDDRYVMAQESSESSDSHSYPDTDKTNLPNSWWFSTCSVRDICQHLGYLTDNCLLDHGFNASEFWAGQKLPLPGSVWSLEEQCELKYGHGSDPCDLEYQDYPDNICSTGIGCTVNGYDGCWGNTKVFSGTPCGTGKVCFKGECVDDDFYQYNHDNEENEENEAGEENEENEAGEEVEENEVGEEVEENEENEVGEEVEENEENEVGEEMEENEENEVGEEVEENEENEAGEEVEENEENEVGEEVEENEENEVGEEVEENEENEDNEAGEEVEENEENEAGEEVEENEDNEDNEAGEEVEENEENEAGEEVEENEENEEVEEDNEEAEVEEENEEAGEHDYYDDYYDHYYQSDYGDKRNFTFNVRKVRKYYIQAEKILWDYLPYGKNMIDNSVGWEDLLVNGPDRVGSKYWKYVYKQYTDATFTTEIPKPDYFGYVGPMLHAEEGEVVIICFRNAADRNLSIHPHGVRYTKANEGALYLDGTSGFNKSDDMVAPGVTIELVWKVAPEFTPLDGDPPCIPFSYHSHINPDREVSAGLLGLIIICKHGMLNKHGRRDDVDHEVVLFTDTVDEARSWLIDENLDRCQNPTLCHQKYQDGDDGAFNEHLIKDQINGYMFGNMPGLDFCAGDKVVFYFFALEKDLHTMNVFGHTGKMRHHRTSMVGIFPATFRAMDMSMTAHSPGRWLIQCLNSEHNTNGMRVFFTITDCGKDDTYELNGVTRFYYLKAEAQYWNYAPSGQNLFDASNGPLTAVGSDSELYYSQNIDGQPLIGGTYIKTRYVRYADGSFTTPWEIPETEAHLGLLGPVIRAEVGDTIKCIIKNEGLTPVSIYLPGTKFDASQIGMLLKKPGNNSYDLIGNVVEPGQVGMYTFTIPPYLSPAGGDSNCHSHMYFSVVNIERDVNTGLVGPFLLCRAGTLDPETGIQRGVDREIFAYFSRVDENESWNIDDNMYNYIGGPVDKDDATFRDSNIMNSINGYGYGNLEGLYMCKGDRVAWHVLSFGDSNGLYGVTFNGNNLLIDGVYRANHVTISGLNFDGIMNADHVGNWSLWSRNTQHYDAGMKAVYTVDACGDTDDVYHGLSGVTRRYYIAAVERQWNHSPETIHPLSGANFSDPSAPQYDRVRTDCPYLGSTYTKALYREFTDASFTQEVPINKRTEHLGLMGPFIRCNVGDRVEVVFKNMASRPYSILAQRLWYEKAHEGTAYQDDAGPQPGDAVAPGGTYTYRWIVPESAGPGPNGPNCVGSIYQSAVDPVKDMYSGLMGPIVICRRGILDAENCRTDSVEAEFALMFLAIDENESWYIDGDIAAECPTANTSIAGWEESNKYDGINGYIFGNLRGLVSHLGDNIAWYIMGLGQSEDVHTAHFHGQVLELRYEYAYSTDVVEVFPGFVETVMMKATNPGTWLLHCHFGEHTVDGMVTTFTILDNHRGYGGYGGGYYDDVCAAKDFYLR